MSIFINTFFFIKAKKGNKKAKVSKSSKDSKKNKFILEEKKTDDDVEKFVKVLIMML